MKKMYLLAAVALSLSLSLQGMAKDTKTPFWLDANVNRVNCEKPRASFFAYENESLAQRMQKESSARFMTLDGFWKFFWVKDHDKAPKGFFAVGYDDSKWVNFKVPGLFEINGYGDRTYKNVGYSWATQFESNPPFVEEKNNYTGSYRREIVVPETWKGEDIYLHVGSATSNLQVWVNGKFVGYSEDSKAEAEFNLTKYLQPGKKNLIAMQVMRWCDGSYVEDQDFWRFSGIARETYLYARPQAHVQDVFITPDLINNYQDGTLSVVATCLKAAGSSLKMELRDASGQTVGTLTEKVPGTGIVNAKMEVKNPFKWTAETPNLYTLYVTLENGKGVLEVIPQRVGFRKVEIRDGQFLVNGKAILIKGADRHEMDPEGGYVVPVSRMIQDIQIMKEHHINAVRTCHYIDDPRWYDLCDQYGIYLTAEANLESHGMGYGDRTLAKNPMYALTHMERNEHNVYINKNHASVIVWSLGNEAGYGPNFEKAYDFIKAYDKSRPVQYEQAGQNGKTDIFCPMYYGYDNCERYAQGSNPRPLIQCEYAHAMGNSEGGFKEYWDIYRKYPKLQGGYIWDFVDQGLRDTNKDGKTIYTYGGDYGRYPATDNNFNCNGLINPDRKPNPHAYEVAYYYQNIWTTPVDLKAGKVKVLNENFFRDLFDVTLYWQLICEGKTVANGHLDQVNAAPQQTVEIQLPDYQIPSGVEGKELMLNVDYKLKADEPLLKAGSTVAYQQFNVQSYQFPTTEGILRADAPAPVKGKKEVAPSIQKEEQLACLTLTAGRTSVTFNKETGWMDYLDVDGQPMFEKGYSLTPDFWRAPTDNDFGAGFQNRFRAWHNPDIRLTAFNCQRSGDNMQVTASYEIRQTASKLQMTYTVTPKGEVMVNEKMTVDANAKEKPYLMRYGMQLVMPEAFNLINFYGRGPVENYSDRNNSTRLNVYSQSVDRQYWGYIRPQESGNKTDVRWWKLSDRSGKGLEFYGVKPMECSTLPYLTEDLDGGTDKDAHQYHSGDLTPRHFSVAHIADRQMGLGCVTSWGAWPLAKYMIPYGDQNFTFIIRPL